MNPEQKPGHLAVSARLTGRGIDVGFEVAAGEVLAVLGPNGAGKSSVAAVIAGVLHADQATVRVGDRTLTDTVRGVQIPPHERRVGLLQQKPLLFPHRSALGNVEFAARRHAGRGPARTEALRWLEAVGAGDLADRRPGELSGGQAQRVAIARALAADPEVLILDEPMSGLDVSSAGSVRSVLRGLLAAEGRAAVLITHDLLDVLALADRVLVLDDGKVAEEGTAADVLAAPRSPFAARLAGVNLIAGTRIGPGVLRSSSGQVWHGMPVELGAGEGTGADEWTGDTDVVAVFPPSGVAVYRVPPQGSPRNSVAVRIADLEVHGSAVRVRGESDGTPGLAADITAAAAGELGLSIGEQVWFTIKAHEVSLYAGRRVSR